MSRYAAPTLLNVMLRAWGRPSQPWKMPRHASSTAGVVVAMMTTPTTRPRMNAYAVTTVGLLEVKRDHQTRRGLTSSDIGRLEGVAGHEEPD